MQPWNYLNTTEGLVWVIACIPLGFILTALSFLVINKIPARWLCEYNEQPSEELLSGKRVKYMPFGLILSVVVSAGLAYCRTQFNRGFDIYFVFFAIVIFMCMIIAISDIKYQIIPDQFTIMLGAAGLLISIYDIIRGFRLLHCAWWSPLAGAALGAAVMIGIDLLGMLVYKREGMGFGDVKLFFAVGILTGIPGTIYTFLISILTATVCFVAVILISSLKGNTEAEAAEKTGSEKESDTESVTEQPTDEEKSEGDKEQEKPESEEVTKTTESEEGEPEGKTGFAAYLAFGPYIAVALAAYLMLYDVVRGLVQMYLNLF